MNSKHPHHGDDGPEEHTPKEVQPSRLARAGALVVTIVVLGAISAAAIVGIITVTVFFVLLILVFIFLLIVAILFGRGRLHVYVIRRGGVSPNLDRHTRIR